MPVDENGTVHFTTTLFALIRESLSIRMGPGLTYLLTRHFVFINLLQCARCTKSAADLLPRYSSSFCG